MRIDRNAILPGLSEASSVSGETTTNSTQAQKRSSSDVATFETASKISTLEGQVRQMPEVRQERVAALARAIRTGQYKVSGDQIAGSMFAAMASLGSTRY
jgi:flagellar biosynthesis anti-sigma factor FlgM